MSAHHEDNPSFIQAIIPIVALVIMLAYSVIYFEDNSSYGPNQIALMLAAGIGILIGLRNGQSWKSIEKGIVKGVAISIPPIMILFAVGALIGTWIMAGIVPTMIYYGLKVLDPSYFYVTACIICSVVSVVTGSSWTTAGTIGIALIGMATAMDMSLPITAGAIVSGAYFGDKISPLSETTNLAPAVAGSELFSHIRHMLWTTIPSIVIALVLYLIIGLMGSTPEQSTNINSFLVSLEQNYNLSLFSLLVPLIVFYMIVKKMPAFPAISLGALLGALYAVFFQPEAVKGFVDPKGMSEAGVILKGIWTSLFAGYTSATGNEAIDSLLSRGGMSSMLNTIWLIICAMFFGGVMETTKILQTIVNTVIKLVSSTRSLIISTIATCIGTNLITSDQYIAIVLPGRMYQMEFKRRNLAKKNLSRCLEDGGTVTSALVPWNTCGAYMTGTLGVGTLLYLPFCFFNILSPIISMVYGITGFTIAEASEEDNEEYESKAALVAS